MYEAGTFWYYVSVAALYRLLQLIHDSVHTIRTHDRPSSDTHTVRSQYDLAVWPSISYRFMQTPLRFHPFPSFPVSLPFPSLLLLCLSPPLPPSLVLLLLSPTLHGVEHTPPSPSLHLVLQHHSPSQFLPLSSLTFL